ncbi:hypothetical protein PsYK624_034150 [Phanerochaete sordida]|uniref:Uncharacterized protein n=1 Tax=Phanerochaete sordida TaxID=48140 RepID=A0A9P3G3B6_9APHY|nr:hypothetical protein PsYK624_034150 [Phanerochaete sordida]
MSYPPVPYPPLDQPPISTQSAGHDLGVHDNSEKSQSESQPALVDEQHDSDPGSAKSEAVAQAVAPADEIELHEDEILDEDATASTVDSSEGREKFDDVDMERLCEDFGAALDDAGKQGSIFFQQTCPEAPNPGLVIADLGMLGLPLNPREAEILKTRCTPPAFPTNSDVPPQDATWGSWELDARMITFQNPKWSSFLGKTVREVCNTLGVGYDSSKPTCTLHKLVLHGPGSHTAPQVEITESPHTFAALTIILPSPHTGGDTQLWHDALASVHPTSASSTFDTSVLAWYTGVAHAIAPVAAGHRLALVYALAHTTRAPPPALAAHTAAAHRLHRLAAAWSAAPDEDPELDEDAPDKIVCLLDHDYAREDMRVGALIGADARRAEALATLARAHGVGFGFATADCCLSGPCDGDHGDDDDDDNPWGRKSWRRSRSSSPESVYHGFDDVEQRDVSLSHFVDAEGRLIADSLEYEDYEAYPEDLTEGVEHGDHDSEKCAEYYHTLERTYTRTALVVWPCWSSITSLLYKGERGLLRACAELAASAPATDTRTLAATILASPHLARHAPHAARTVADFAVGAGDARLWRKAVKACAPHGGLAVLPDAKKLAALERFGWEGVRAGFEKMLHHEQHNAPRFAFLERVAQWAAMRCPAGPGALLAWVAERAEKALARLRTPAKEECGVLLGALAQHGGLPVLDEVVLPQLLALSDKDFLEDFARHLFADAPLGSEDEKHPIVAKLVDAVLSKTTFYQPHGPADQTAHARRCIKLCVDTGCANLVPSTIDRIVDVSALSPGDAQGSARTVMLPLLAWCMDAKNQEDGAQAVPDACIDKLRETGVKLYLDWCASNFGYNRAYVATLVRATATDGDPTRFMTLVVPRLKAMTLRPDACRALAEELHAQPPHFAFPAGYAGETVQDVVGHFLGAYVRALPQQLAAAQECIQLCVDVGCRALVAHVVERVADTADVSLKLRASEGQRRARDVMLPLLAWLVARRLKEPDVVPDAGVEKLRKAGVKLYLDWILGPAFEIARAHVTTLWEVTVVDGDPTSFVKAVIPRLKSAKISPVSCRSIAEELNVQRTNVTYPPGYEGEKLDVAAAYFSAVYVSSVLLTKPHNVTETLDWCIAMKSPVLVPAFVQRLTSNQCLGHNSIVTNVLLPVLPDLRKRGVQHGILDALAPVFARTLSVWTDRVLGPLPTTTSAALSAQLAGLARWTCSCYPCKRAREVLTQSPERVVRVESIGANNRKHLESKLAQYAGALATWTLLRTTPQGLEIRKKDGLHQLVRWRTEQMKGLGVLQAMGSDDAELRRLLGEHYDRVVARVWGAAGPPGGRPVAHPAAAAAAAPPPPPAELATGLPAPAAVARPASEAGQPPPKRRKVAANSENIIDLT